VGRKEREAATTLQFFLIFLYFYLEGHEDIIWAVYLCAYILLFSIVCCESLPVDGRYVRQEM
jgi:hypothetical protein